MSFFSYTEAHVNLDTWNNTLDNESFAGTLNHAI